MATTIVAPYTHEQGLAEINRLMPTVVAGWKKADDLTLAHEAERLEGQQASPVVRSMRLLVAAELLSRGLPIHQQSGKRGNR